MLAHHRLRPHREAYMDLTDEQLTQLLKELVDFPKMYALRKNGGHIILFHADDGIGDSWEQCPCTACVNR